MKTAPSRSIEPEAEREEETDTTAEVERWLRCSACGARITRASARIEVNGAHEHRFMNPSGIHYIVGCYASAPGCAPDGERSSVWTWFPGHAWQVELCRSCGCHLGWSFHLTSSFYGLVQDRLV